MVIKEVRKKLLLLFCVITSNEKPSHFSFGPLNSGCGREIGNTLFCEHGKRRVGVQEPVLN